MRRRSHKKIESACATSEAELKRLSSLHEKNKRNFNRSVGRPSANQISAAQMNVLTEGILLRAFRQYENLVSEVIILCALGKAPPISRRPKCYLSTRNRDHAENMFRSNQKRLEWANVQEVIKRCDLYFEKDMYISVLLKSKLTLLEDIRLIRNHIAHNSEDSYSSYTKRLVNYTPIIPSIIPEPGMFLQQTFAKTAPDDLLSYFLKQLQVITNGMR
jgi:hypothetical protein